VASEALVPTEKLDDHTCMEALTLRVRRDVKQVGGFARQCGKRRYGIHSNQDNY